MSFSIVRGEGPARCTVLDAFVNPGRGLTLRAALHEGVLHEGDVFVCGMMVGRVKCMHTPDGVRVVEGGALPGMVVEAPLLGGEGLYGDSLYPGVLRIFGKEESTGDATPGNLIE